MGYLNNSTVTVDAILTTKGREALSKGSEKGLDIKYFALGDDEVNYDLWNPAHPLGSDYYGIIIENMPVLEASPIPEQNLKSKLITLPKGTQEINTIQTSQQSIGPVLYNNIGNKVTSTTSTTITFSLSSNGGGNNDTLGYTVTYDPRYFRIIPITPLSISTTSAIGDAVQNSLTSIVTKDGITLTFLPNLDLTLLPAGVGNLSQNIFVQGNEVGGTITIPVSFAKIGN
jgi:hypothetical protein